MKKYMRVSIVVPIAGTVFEIPEGRIIGVLGQTARQADPNRVDVIVEVSEATEAMQFLKEVAAWRPLKEVAALHGIAPVNPSEIPETG